MTRFILAAVALVAGGVILWVRSASRERAERRAAEEAKRREEQARKAPNPFLDPSLIPTLLPVGIKAARIMLRHRGLLVALVEMAMVSHIGAVLEAPDGVAPHAFWFGEDQARYVLTAKDAGAVMRRAQAAGVPLTQIGATGGRVLAVADERPRGRPLPTRAKRPCQECSIAANGRRWPQLRQQAAR